MKQTIRNILENITTYSINSFDDEQELSLDSISIVSIIIELENYFSISISETDFDIENFQTINSIYNLVKKYCNK